MLCPHCNKENQEGSLSCAWCGAAFPQATQTVPAIAPLPQNPPLVPPVTPTMPPDTSVAPPPASQYSQTDQPLTAATAPLMPPQTPVMPAMAPAAAEAAPLSPTGAVLPDGVKGWSWAAFLWTWVWAIGNKTYIGLLALVPIPGLALLMAIILGIYGREWAWKNTEWESVEQFNEAQRKWVKWWLILAIVGFVLAIFGGVMSALYAPALNQPMQLP